MSDSRASVRKLGSLQLQILKHLWSHPKSTVAEVHEALASLNLAFTTVATMLRKMEERGLVKHDTEGRKFLYSAAVQEQAVTRGMAGELLDKLFEGSLANMVSHLLTMREVSRTELDQIEKLVAERKKRK
ncbi:MAG TPA: BlaI/MecI/CopY family transcriptional regulator [Methylomirabilota bacterium]|nr:BlaI/MecI/CopY family transcriptional regulator [Methylomirabilota bacterium]